MTQVQNEKAQRVIKWRESLTMMSDDHFFEIMRTFLGSVQTPYNKPNLIERLSAVFRKEQNKRRIISYLSDFDIKMLSLISLLSKPNQEKVLDFFSKDFTLSEIYTELLSLSDRLLIFSYKDEDSHQIIIALNPLLEDCLKPLLGLENLLPDDECAEQNFNIGESLTPLCLAGFISYIRSSPNLCKNNLTFRKKDIQNLNNIFPNFSESFPVILNAFFNLGITFFGDKGIQLNEKRLEKFAILPELWQYAYLTTAGSAHFGRTGLRLHAQLLLDLASSVPEKGFTRSALKKAGFVFANSKKFQESTGFTGSQGSFSRMLEARRSVDFETESSSLSQASSSASISLTSGTSTANYSGQVIEKICESAIALKLFTVHGKTETGEEIFVPAQIFFEAPQDYPSKKGLMNINAGTNITIMPGLKLSELIPFTRFMEIQKYSTVAEFEISRKSASRAFDGNITPEDIFGKLENYSAYEIPQNLRMNIDEWYKTYSSAVLYKGYVLKVDEKTARILEKNPRIERYIQLKLSDNIFLLNIPLEQNIDEFVQESNLDFIGSVKEAESSTEVSDFPILERGLKLQVSSQNSQDYSGQQSEWKLTDELKIEGKKAKEEFIEELKKLELSKQVYESLSQRIMRGVIITKEQINPESVRIELLEADGMNYAGKVRLVENAISDGDSVEIEMADDSEGSKMVKFLGKPISVTKHPNDSLLKIALEPEGDIRLFSISRANKIRLIKTSVFR